MDTLLEPKTGWPSGREEDPIASSERTRVYDVPFSHLYEVEAMNFDGDVQLFETRAYTDHIFYDDDGHVTIEIGAKSERIPTPTIPYPYHMLHQDVLFAFKRNKFNVGNEFALNFDLFCLDFKMVVILHFDGKDGGLFISGTDEWQSNGRIGTSNRELQLYLGVARNRLLPLPYGQILLKDKKVQDWMAKCKQVQEYKG